MNPSTGTFISMDSYQGSIYDPVMLHKYLYANVNPVMYADPSGYTSVAEAGIYMDCTTSLNVAQAYYDAMVFALGMQIISQLRTIITVESAAYVSLDTIVSIGMEGALSGKNSKEMTDEVLMEMLDAITEIEDCYERGL